VARPEGIEQPADSSGNEGVTPQGGAQSGALPGDSTPIDPRLAAIIDAWPRLPDAIKSGILAIIQGAEGQHDA
jgi:hypothetical protein